MKRLFVFFLLFSSILTACPFCDPYVEKNIFLEEGTALGVCTNHPIFPGHVLVIPRRHVERFEDLSDQEICDIGAATRRIHEAAIRLFGENDYMLLQKNGASAGQSVFHVHFHYYARSEKMGTFGFLWRFLLAPYWGALNEKEMDDQVQMWKRAFSCES